MADRDRFQGPLVPWLRELGKGWHGDVDARWRGWYVLRKDKLYFDPNTHSFYDYDHNRVKPEVVKSQFNIDPNNPLATATGATMTSYATDVLNRTTAQPPAQATTEGTPVVKVPGKLLLMPNGTWADYNGMPVDPAVAKRMLDEYEASSPGNLAQEALAEQAQREAEYQNAINIRDDFIRGQGAMGRLQARAQDKYEGESTEEKSRIFEAARGQLLSGLDPIVDAFQYWPIANKENKWAKKIQEGRDEVNPNDRLVKWETEVEKYERMKKRADEMEKAAKADPNRSLSFGEQQYIEEARWRYEHAQNMVANAQYELTTGKKSPMEMDAPTWERDPRTGEKIGEPHFGSQPQEGRGYRPWTLPKPDTPPAPEWLAKQFPEATQELNPLKYDLRGTTGTRAIKLAGLTPSAQGWNRMLPSEQAGFMSHARWSGGVPEDVMGRMQSMLPQPKRGARWTPFR